eukprot:166444_1
MANLWLVGAFLSIAGSVCSNIGVNVQKHGQNINARRHADDRRSYHNQPFWWLGLFLVIVGSLGDFFALGFAAQSIVAPIGSITLVANIFFGRFCLQEHLQRTDIHAAAAMQSEPERKNFPSIFRWKKKEHALIGGQQKSEYTEY